MSVEEVEGWMEVGELEGVETNHSIVLPWAKVVSFAMGFWEQEEIEEALGADVAEAIPELDLVSAQSEWLASVIPGFAAALSWPY